MLTDQILYLKSGKRRPVLLHPVIGLRDMQAQIPHGWCMRCGREVYRFGSALCADCFRRKEEEKEYE